MQIWRENYSINFNQIYHGFFIGTLVNTLYFDTYDNNYFIFEIQCVIFALLDHS